MLSNTWRRVQDASGVTLAGPVAGALTLALVVGVVWRLLRGRRSRGGGAS